MNTLSEKVLFCITFFILCQIFDMKCHNVNDMVLTNTGLSGLPDMNEKMVRFSAEKPQNIPPPEPSSTGVRPKRQTGVQYKPENVCPSVSDWVVRSDAMDQYGNALTLAQRIPINGTLINQYFYETFCIHSTDDSYGFVDTNNHHKGSQCRAIDSKVYESECKERYIWTYGKVVADNGDTGWSVIAIRGSCDCSFWPNQVTNTGRNRRISRFPNRIQDDPFL